LCLKFCGHPGRTKISQKNTKGGVKEKEKCKKKSHSETKKELRDGPSRLKEKRRTWRGLGEPLEGVGGGDFY